jgi:Tol biopolymer transport system component
VITKYSVDGSSEYIALTPNDEDARQPNWSPDGSKILYQKLVDGQWDIWTMNIDGSNKTKVTTGSGDKTDASFVVMESE